MKHFYTTNLSKYRGKIGTALLFFTVLLLNLPLQAQIAGWEMNGLSAYGPSPFAVTTQDLNVTVGGLTRGVGFTTAGTASLNAWGGNGLNATSLENAITEMDFATFTVQADSGFSISLERLSRYNIQRSATGPTTGQWQYSLDGVTFTNIGNAINWGSNTEASGTTHSSIDLILISDLQYVASTTIITFRVVSWGATDAEGTWYINNFINGLDLELMGIVNQGTQSCTPPNLMPSGFSVMNTTTTSMNVNWSNNGSGDNVLVVARAGSAVDAHPANGETYFADASFGLGGEIGTGNYVVYNGSGTTVNVTALQPGLEYFFAIYTYNSVDNCYNLTPLTGSEFTECVIVTDISDLNLNCGNISESPSWTHATCYDEYMMVVKLDSSITGIPSGDGTGYADSLEFGAGDAFDGGYIVYIGSEDFTEGNITGLINGQTYYYKVYTRLGTAWSAGLELNCSQSIALCVDEDFSANTIPAGWLSTSVDFTVSPGGASFNEIYGELATFSITNPYELRFDLFRNDDSTDKWFFVEISTTSQESGFSIISTYNHSNTIPGINPIVIDLLPYNSFTNVYIRFRKVCTTTNPWILDNVEVICLAALPVNLLTFQATADKNNQVLSWTYEFPERFDYFEVEHSRDSRNYNALGRVSEGQLTSRAYSANYTHIRPGAGIHYYRLRMVDKDGSFAFSQMVQGKIDGSGSVRPLSTFINTEGLNIFVETSVSSMELRLVDQLGRTIYYSTQPVEAGIFNIPVNNLNAGMYFLQINADGAMETHKLVR